MKTALNLIADKIQEEKLIDFLDWFHDHIDELFDLEKEQIVNAFESGQQETANGFYTRLGEKYFNKNYVDDKKN
jgi:hypothetical protein